MFELQLTGEKMGEGEMTITLMCEVFEGFFRLLPGFRRYRTLFLLIAAKSPNVVSYLWN